MAGPCKLAESLARFLTDHTWWIQNHLLGVHTVAGLFSLILPPLMTQGVPRLSETAWQGGFTSFAPWPAPGLLLVPLVQLMTPQHYQAPGHLRTAIREAIYDTLMAPFNRQLTRAQPVAAEPLNTPMMAKIVLLEVAYVTEMATQRTLVIDPTSTFGRRLLRLQARLAAVVREAEANLEVVPTALTVHAM